MALTIRISRDDQVVMIIKLNRGNFTSVRQLAIPLAAALVPQEHLQ